MIDILHWKYANITIKVKLNMTKLKILTSFSQVLWTKESEVCPELPPDREDLLLQRGLQECPALWEGILCHLQADR